MRVRTLASVRVMNTPDRCCFSEYLLAARTLAVLARTSIIAGSAVLKFSIYSVCHGAFIIQIQSFPVSECYLDRPDLCGSLNAVSKYVMALSNRRNSYMIKPRTA